jgi:hypothetical protein
MLAMKRRGGACWPFMASYDCTPLRMTVCVIRDGRLGVGGRLLSEKLGAEEPRG